MSHVRTAAGQNMKRNEKPTPVEWKIDFLIFACAATAAAAAAAATTAAAADANDDDDNDE